MKLKLYFISLLVVGFFFVSCASVPSSKVTYDIQIEYESENSPVTLNITPAWTNSILGSGFRGFECTFTNHSDKSAKVVWDESSLNYNGNTYVPFLDGQRYIKAQEPMSPAVIAKGGTISKGVYSSNQPHYTSGQYGGWSMHPIEANEVQLIFMIKSDSKEEYITATVKSIINKD